MPTSEDVLGFGSEWYPLIRASVEPCELPSGARINLVSGPGLLATKLAAFAGRGQQDFTASHDKEDLVAVVDGRAGLVNEIEAADVRLREYLATEFDRLLHDPRFQEALPGRVLEDSGSPDRITMVLDRLHAIASLA